MSLAVTAYVKQFYRGNLFGAKETERAGYHAYNLISPDIKAVRRAVKELGNYDYDEGEGSELMNKVQAFVQTYNNYIDSSNGLDDSNADRYLSKMKKLTKENTEDLGEIGITIQSSGKLKVDKDTLQDATRYQVSRLFSEDADYAAEVEKQMKRTNNMVLRNNLNIPKTSPAKKTNPAAQEVQEADAQLAVQLAQALSGSWFDQSV